MAITDILDVFSDDTGLAFAALGVILLVIGSAPELLLGLVDQSVSQLSMMRVIGVGLIIFGIIFSIAENL